MAETPKWATRLAAQVFIPENVPQITWRRKRRNPARIDPSSSGRYMTNEHRVVITAGTGRTDQKLVLLHEFAHALTPREHHGEAFWHEAWALYRRFGLTKYALKREAKYREAATRVAKDLGIRGARAAAKTGAAYRASRQPRGVCPMPEDQAARHGYRTPHTHYVGTVHRWTEPDGSYVDYWTDRR